MFEGLKSCRDMNKGKRYKMRNFMFMRLWNCLAGKLLALKIRSDGKIKGEKVEWIQDMGH